MRLLISRGNFRLTVPCGRVIILLHDPHANVGGSGCLSAFKILEAARAILDLIYSVRGSSYDVTLLDFFVTVRPVPNDITTDLTY